MGIVTLILSALDFFGGVAPYVFGVDALLFLYLVITPFLYPMIEYRQWAYTVTGDRIEIRKGIFFISTTVIPIIRIQHIAIEEGIINRRLGLATVEIHTASGAFSIEGLSVENARNIADALKSKINSRLEAQNKVKV
jgi:membrane protein YdbS with pleckstrin-like domain